MSCLLGYVQNPRDSGTPKGWEHYLTFQNLICCLYNRRRYIFDWDYSSDWACSTHTRKVSDVGQETRREHFEDIQIWRINTQSES